MTKFRNLSEAKAYIKDNVDLASWVSRHTKLAKSSDGFKGRCPLPGHAEKTPSFHVNTRHNFFHCFGCDRGGDIFTFLQLMEGLNFKESLERVAETMNLELPRFSEDDKNSKEKDRFRAGYELMHRAASFYNRVLIEEATPGATRALAYLKTRGIGAEWIEKFQLGWAPEAPQSLAKKLTDKSEIVLAQEVGLLRNYNGVNYDFFQNRLMIPVHNDRARVVAFSGRTLDPVVDKNPKYKNSPETYLFKKKEVLYGYSQVQDLLREKEYAVFVEGFFDQWALARVGIPAMAVMGTALTEEHLKLVERWTKHLVLMMDSDEAGKRSVLRSLPLLLGKHFEAKVFSVPSGKDPDEWLQDPKAVENAENILRRAPEALEWWALLLIVEGEEKRLNRLQILNRLQEVWEWTPSVAHRNFLSMQLAPRLGMRPKDFAESLNGITPPQNYKVKRDGANSAAGRGFTESYSMATPSLTNVDKSAEALLLWWIRFWEQLTPKSHSAWDHREELFRSTLAEDLVHSWSQAYFHAHGALSRETIKASLESDSLEPVVKQWIIKGFVDGIESSQAFDSDQVQRDWDELERHLQVEKLRSQVNVLKQKVKIESENPETSAQLLQQITELTQKLNNYLEK
jgi:DNA primase